MRVICLTCRVRIHISEFDNSITQEEVATMIADSGKCFVADLKVSRVVQNRRGLGSIVVQYLVTVAAKIAQKRSLALG